jgi:type VI secretion system protein ImpG
VPVDGVRVVAGPSRPYSALREGGVAWRLLNLLSLNYLSLLDTEGGEAAAALRDLLGDCPGRRAGGAPADRGAAAGDGLARGAPPPGPGPIAFSRGIEVADGRRARP